MTMAIILENAGAVLDFAIDSVADVATTVAGTPLLLCGALVSIAFIGVGLFKRLLSTTI